MDYVESFYLAAKPEQDEPTAPPTLEQQQQQMAIPQEAVVSDYLGFIESDLPPIYRQQLQSMKQKAAAVRTAPISKLYVPVNPNDATMNESILNSRKYFAPPNKSEKKKETGKTGSNYAYDAKMDSNHYAASPAAVFTNIYTKDYDTMDLLTFHDYVPGFSPPKDSDLIHKRSDAALPQGRYVEMTENVYQHTGKQWIKGARGNVEAASKYITMPNEDFYSVNKPKGETSISETGSAADDSSSISSSESSAMTARLGPPLGSLMMPATQDRNKGLNAFKPVSNSIESQYAYPALN